MTKLAYILTALTLVSLADAQVVRRRPPTYWNPTAAGTYTATVQRGVGSLYGVNTSVDVDVTEFDSTKSWVIVQAATDGVNEEGNRYTVDIVDGNTIRIARGSVSSGYMKFNYAIITDPGLSVSRYRGTFSSANDTTSVTISSVTTTKTWIHPMFRSAIAQTWADQSSVSAELNNSTTIKLRRGNYGTKRDISYVIQVVTYDSCTVEHGLQIGMGTAVTKDVTITSVDTNKSFAFFSLHHTAEYGYDMADWGWFASWASPTSLRFTRNGNFADYRVYYQIVSFTDGSTVKPIVFGDTSADSLVVTVSAADTARAAFLGCGYLGQHSALNNNTAERNHTMWYYRFNNSTTGVVMIRRFGDSINSKGKSYIIEWKGWG